MREAALSMAPLCGADDPWEHWNQVRCLCGHNSRLGLVLDIPTSLPSQAEIVRWAAVLPRSAVCCHELDAGVSGYML